MNARPKDELQRIAGTDDLLQTLNGITMVAPALEKYAQGVVAELWKAWAYGRVFET